MSYKGLLIGMTINDKVIYGKNKTHNGFIYAVDGIKGYYTLSANDKVGKGAYIKFSEHQDILYFIHNSKGFDQMHQLFQYGDISTAKIIDEEQANKLFPIVSNINSPYYREQIYGISAKVIEGYYSIKQGTNCFIASNDIVDGKVKIAIPNFKDWNCVVKHIPLTKVNLYLNQPRFPVWYLDGSYKYPIGTKIEFLGELDGSHLFDTGVITEVFNSNNDSFSKYCYRILTDDSCHGNSFVVSDYSIRLIKDNANILDTVAPVVDNEILYGWFVNANPYNGDKEYSGQYSNKSNWLEEATQMKELSECKYFNDIIGDYNANNISDDLQEVHFKFDPKTKVCSYQIREMVLPELLGLKTMLAKKSINDVLKKFNVKTITKLTQLPVKVEGDLICNGDILSKGIGEGKVVSINNARTGKDINGKYILYASMTLPSDVELIKNSQGVILTTGSPTCHASIICNQLNIPAILIKSSHSFNGNYAIDCINGNIYKDYKIVEDKSKLSSIIEIKDRLASVIKDVKLPIEICANADTKEQMLEAIKAGATKVGLFRIEHAMLNYTNFIKDFITREDEYDVSNSKYVTTLYGIIKNLPYALDEIIVRILDAPLHEFVPDKHESNPMLGYRGTRVLMGNRYKTSIHWHLCKINSRVKLELPMVNSWEEVKFVSETLMAGHGLSETQVQKRLGVMIETPSACLQADKLAKYCSFMSFGTNDLTQTTLALSRDDAMSFMDRYSHLGNPFQTLHPQVLELMKICIDRARSVNPNMKFSLCGEQGSDINTMLACIDAGINAVSISPSKITMAKYSLARTLMEMNKEVD